MEMLHPHEIHFTQIPPPPPPPFATLALVQNAGGAYTRDVTFSFTITPSLDREMFSGSVDAGFVLALPFHHGGGGWGGGGASVEREAERCSQR